MGKKLYRRLGILILLLAAMAVFTGCQPAKVSTQTEINSDLSGERVITVKIEKSVVNQYYSGTMQQMSAIIDAACPEELSWSYEENGSAYELQFVLAFSSIDDYNAKVHRIITNQEYNETIEPWVEFEDTSTFWKKRLYFEEDFTSIELLKWLKNALVKEGVVSQRDSAYIFSSGDNYVSYGEEKYSTYAYAYVEDKEFVEYKRIEIHTIANEDGTYNREILFVIEWDEAVSFSYETAIREAMADFIPEGAVTSWEVDEENSEQIFKISKENMDVSGVNAFMADCFGQNSATFSVREYENTSMIFSLQKNYNETVNFTRYYDSDMLFAPDVVYYIKSEDGYTLVGNDKASSAKGVSMLSENKSFSVAFQRCFTATNVQVVTEVLDEDEFERTIKIAFDKAPMGTDLSKIERNILEMRLFGDITVGDASTNEEQPGELFYITVQGPTLEEYAKMLNIEIIAEEVNGVLVYTFVQRGSSEDIESSSILLFGQSGKLAYGKTTKGGKLQKEMVVSQNINLSRLLSQTTAECEIDYIIVLPKGSKIDYCNFAGFEVKGRRLTIHTTGKDISVSVVAKSLNGWSVGLWCSVLTFVAGAVLILIKYGYLQKVVSMVKERIVIAKEQQEEEEPQLIQKQSFGLERKNAKSRSESIVHPQGSNDSANAGEESVKEPVEEIEILEENLENLDIEIDL